MANETSEAIFYNLREIPFEPTGAATEKYPYVAPKKFNVIEQMMDEVVSEKKLYVVLFRAPQGGGKTATASELRRRIEAKKYVGGKVVAITNRLIDLDFAHYASDFIEQATPLLPDFRWDKYKGKTSPGELKNAITSVLKTLSSDYKLVVWLIDEFDILVDYPKEKQSQFLQILREIIDDLSNESLPILFIMSHTEKSSKEFEKHLRDTHGPLQSRVVTTIDIGYTYSEVKAIVTERLRSVRIEQQAYNSLEPFTEDALRDLYNLILATGGTGELNDFRLFERCCYFAILEGARNKERQILKDRVQAEFQKQFKLLAKPEADENLSIALRSDRNSVLAGTLMMRNEAILRGLEKGLKLTTDQISDLLDVKTLDLGRVSNNVNLGALRCIAHHKPSGKWISLLWLLASKGDGLILPDDVKEINAAAGSIRSEQTNYVNLLIVSYISEFDLDTAQLTNADQIIRITSDTSRDLIGLGLESATADDIDVLRKGFDSDIAVEIRHILEVSTRDITKDVTDTVQHLAITLNVVHAAGRKLTKETLKDETKKLFRSGRAQDKNITDLIALGFAKEEGTQIVPTVPKALTYLDQLLRKQGPLKQDVIQKQFGPNSDSIIKVSKGLGLVNIDENGMISRVQADKDVESLASTTKLTLSSETSKTLDADQAYLLAKAVEKSDADSISGTIVRSAARTMLPQLTQNLVKQGQVDLEKGSSGGSPPYPPMQTPPQADTIQRRNQDSGVFESKVVTILKGKGQAMTLEELKRELLAQGFSTDVNSKIIGMIIQNKLKVTA
jgi:hypothetical protein